jgi:nucleotide-binding universal stress UspA family protein
MGKDILAIVDTSDEDAQFIDYAIALASARKTRLEIGLVGPIPVPGAPSAFGLPYPDADAFNKAFAAKESRVRSRAKQAGITVRLFLDDPLMLLQKMGAESRLWDLILLGPIAAYDSARFRHEIAKILVFSSGRPVILQSQQSEVEPLNRIVIGWTGTREAARTLHAALSIAPPQACFDIVTVDRGSKKEVHLQPSAHDVALHLTALGRSAQACHVDAGEQSVSAALVAFARGHSANLLAIGAYSHSRLRETVFGGVTKDLLVGAEIAILMVH